MTLRPYQQAAIDTARAAFVQGARAALIVAPTGAGKGTMAAEGLLAPCAARGRRGLFIVHRDELVRDMAARLQAAGLDDVGIEIGSTRSSDERIIVGTVQSVTRRALDDVDLIVTDEAHHATAKSYAAVYARFPNAKHVGLTATPSRQDGTPLGDVFDRLIVAATVRELTDSGQLVPCDVWAPPERQRGMAATPVEAYRGQVARWARELGSMLLPRAIVFCRDVAHSKDVAATFRLAGVEAAHVDGEMPAALRAQALDRFRSGVVRVLSNVHIIAEGFDLPEIGVVILASPCSHAGSFLQRVGRALRPAPGKPRALVVDLYGVVFEHGLPDSPRVFSLEGSPIRVAKGEPGIVVRQCVACGQCALVDLYKAGACPACGAHRKAKRDPRVERAELARVRAAMPTDQKLLQLRRILSWSKSDKQARMVFAKMFGHWPSEGMMAEAYRGKAS